MKIITYKYCLINTNHVHNIIGDTMKKMSLWLDGEKDSHIMELNKNINTDVLIIGGGITGMTTAYQLINSNLKVVLIDQNLIGHGVSSKTTGKLNYLQENIYTSIKNTFSVNEAELYLKAQLEAIQHVNEIINTNHIKCNFEWVQSYLFTDKDSEIPTIKREKKLLEQMGINVKEHQNIEPNLKCKYAISVQDTAVFHPIKYLYALKKICIKNKIDIYENTQALKINIIKDGFIVETDKEFKIKAKKIVVANHYPFFILPFFMPIKTYIEKSYISASPVTETKSKTYITSSYPCKSIRYHQDKANGYMIYLNGSHTICNKLNEKQNFDNLIQEANKLNLEPLYIWANDDLMTSDKLPFIGCINDEKSLFIGTGYNTWGMTNGTIAGIILSDLIQNKKNIYTKLFNPNRKFNFAKAKQYPINLYNNISGFYKSKISKNKNWYSDKIKFKTIDGKKLAIYTDNKGEHIVYNKCPHMGCSLIFNEVEHTWDCPCHASRFDIDGTCIKGPSTYNISYKRDS